MTLIATDGSTASCGDTLSAAHTVYVEGAAIGVDGDKAVGPVAASQSTVKAESTAVLLKGDSVAIHGTSEPHTKSGLEIVSTPNTSVSIG